MNTEQKQNRDRYRDQMESMVPSTNVHTGLRQGPGLNISCCASPFSCTGDVIIPIQCECKACGFQPVSLYVSEISTLNMVEKLLVVTG